MKEVKDIIEKSGNTFHCKVLKFFKDQGWSVLISPYYNDNTSGKPREIDLIAEKAFKFQDSFGQFMGNVNVKLFIECKYISQKTVFWFHGKDREKAENLVERTSPCRKDDPYTKEHHYLCGDDHVAKLFADEKAKAADNEIFYKALNQSLNALIYYRGDKNSIIPVRESRKSYTKYTLNYPIIVCNSFDNLYRVNIETDDDPLNINENFQLEINYAYMGQSGIDSNEYFLIDIVKFELINNLLDTIKKDADLAGFFLSST